MSTSAKRPIVGHFLGSVSERVLRLIDQPVLLVGPHVPPSFQWSYPTPIVCVDDTDVTMEAVPTIAAWMQTFRTGYPWIVEVVPARRLSIRHVTPSSRRTRDVLATAFSTHGINASWEVLHGERPGGLPGAVRRPVRRAHVRHDEYPLDRPASPLEQRDTPARPAQPASGARGACSSSPGGGANRFALDKREPTLNVGDGRQLDEPGAPSTADADPFAVEELAVAPAPQTTNVGRPGIDPP